MRVIENEAIWCCDVDDTLVHSDFKEEHFGQVVDILCPHTDELLPHRVNLNNVRLLREKAARGATIIVWSQGGYAWAQAVVTALKIEPIVDYVMTKPQGVIDDLKPSAWMPLNIWIDPNKKYKK